MRNKGTNGKGTEEKQFIDESQDNTLSWNAQNKAQDERRNHGPGDLELTEGVAVEAEDPCHEGGQEDLCDCNRHGESAGFLRWLTRSTAAASGTSLASTAIPL